MHNPEKGQDQETSIVEKVVKINRVNKVVKGGKRLAFRALVIVGDQKGQVGLALGKSKEVPSAIKKAIDRAKKSMVMIRMVNGTIPHEVFQKFGSAKILLRPAKPGTGVIAGGSVRIVLEAAGIKDIVAKCQGSSNAINSAKAALKGLLSLKDFKEEQQKRGVKLGVADYYK
jgi:small subunit ribosomal protein S5